LQIGLGLTRCLELRLERSRDCRVGVGCDGLTNILSLLLNRSDDFLVWLDVVASLVLEDAIDLIGEVTGSQVILVNLKFEEVQESFRFEALLPVWNIGSLVLQGTNQVVEEVVAVNDDDVSQDGVELSIVV